MPATARMKDLTEQKRGLVLQAALHRQAIALERWHIQERGAAIHEQVAAHRWWWIGGAALAGWLTARPTGGIIRWLPMLATVSRVMRRFGR